MAWSFGNIFRDAAQTFPGAFARAQEMEERRPARELQELQAEQIRAELDRQAKFESDLQDSLKKGGVGNQVKKKQTVSVVGKFRPIAQLPPGKARKIPVEAFSRQAQAQMRVMPSKSFTDFLMSADQETLNAFFDETENNVYAMEEADPKMLMKVISDDAASAEAITKTQVKVEATRAAAEKQAGEAKNGGDLNPVATMEAKDRARLQKINSRWQAAKQAYDSAVQTYEIMAAKGHDPQVLEARLGPQIKRLEQQFTRLDELRKEQRGNVRENAKGQVQEFREVQGELRRDALGDQDRWQAAAVEQFKKSTDRNPVQVILPDGTGMTVLSDGMGKFYDPSGNPVQLPPDARIAAASLQGGAQEIGLTPATRTEIQQGLMQADSALARLDMMTETFNPDFLTLQGKGKAALITGAQKLGIDVPESMDVFGNDFAAFSANVQDNLNVTIKDLTGAAMTTAEVPRIEGSIATMNRSPEQFVRVMKEVRKRVEASKARLEIYEKRGIGQDRITKAMQGEERNPLGVSLEDASKYVDKKNELREQVLAKKITKEKANKEMSAFLESL